MTRLVVHKYRGSAQHIAAVVLQESYVSLIAGCRPILLRGIEASQLHDIGSALTVVCFP
jgi:hypothetical protein